MEQKAQEEAQEIQHIDTNDSELVLWVEVFHASREPSKTQSFLVLGSEFVTELMDLVVCTFDQRLQKVEKASKMFFFNGFFCVDQRKATNLNYATEILHWIAQNPSAKAHYGTQFKIVRMETTRFRELPLQLDVAGVLMHQGECEHLVRVRDVRLRHEWDAKEDDDVVVAAAFPMRLPNSFSRTIRPCLICYQFSAKFLCYGDPLSTESPMFFCENCFQKAHYDATGNLINQEFQAFPYYQD